MNNDATFVRRCLFKRLCFRDPIQSHWCMNIKASRHWRPLLPRPGLRSSEIILMTHNNLLFHCHHSPCSKQVAGCPIQTFSFHLHSLLLLAVYNFKVHIGSTSIPLRSLALISLRYRGMSEMRDAVLGTNLFVDKFTNYQHDGRSSWPVAVIISKTVSSTTRPHVRTHTGWWEERRWYSKNGSTDLNGTHIRGTEGLCIRF
jgi:hypothetical protein